MGTELPPEERAQPPHQILAHVYCGQKPKRLDGSWMKTPLGAEVDNVLDGVVGVPASRERGRTPPPSFRPMFIVATVAHLSYCSVAELLLMGLTTAQRYCCDS